MKSKECGPYIILIDVQTRNTPHPWLKPGREAALKRAEMEKSPNNPPAKAGGKEEPAQAG
jgi:hypothetical protein